ncbi:MAG: hypothetical protein RL112_2833, partial [Planctomycetota bacterium]
MTRWMCAKDDQSPMLAVECAQPLKFDRIVLHPAQRTAVDVGTSDRLVKVSVKVGKEKPVEVVCPENEIEPVVVRFDKPQSTKRVEIRIVERAPGGSLRGGAGFSEIIFEKPAKKD